jgi:hypothetical protein
LVKEGEQQISRLEHENKELRDQIESMNDSQQSQSVMADH